MCICQILPWATFHKCKFKEGSDSKENIGTLPVAVFAPSKVFEENSEGKTFESLWRFPVMRITQKSLKIPGTFT